MVHVQQYIQVYYEKNYEPYLEWSQVNKLNIHLCYTYFSTRNARSYAPEKTELHRQATRWS